MASIATGLDYHSLGAETATGAEMRKAQDDQSGGTDSGDARVAWDRGYGEALRVRDGETWAAALEDLRAGRLVHLDVWHATVGGPCLSGSGAYGHTIAVAPEYSDGKWLVADPWCSPPKWVWVLESKLRAGAEEWGRRVYSTARAEPGYPTDGPDPRDPRVLAIVRYIVKRFMTLSRPGRITPIPRGEDTAGAQPILYTTTDAREDDMGFAIRYPGGGRYGIVTVPAGVEVYRVADSEPITVGSGGSTGPGCSAIHDVEGGSPGFAYTSGASATTYWVRATDAALDDGDGDTDARDAQWRAWLLEGSPGSD